MSASEISSRAISIFTSSLCRATIFWKMVSRSKTDASISALLSSDSIGPRVNIASSIVDAFVEHTGRGLEFFVFEQAVDEFVSRIFDLFFFAGKRVAGKQHLGLDLDQRRRHHEKIGRDRDVEAFHEANVLEIFLGNASDRNVENIGAFLTDQEQKQIERTGEIADLDLQVSEHRRRWLPFRGENRMCIVPVLRSNVLCLSQIDYVIDHRGSKARFAEFQHNIAAMYR